MERDERLEELSELVRRGIPIGFIEAIEVIDYQSKLKNERAAKEAATLRGRIKRLFRRIATQREVDTYPYN